MKENKVLILVDLQNDFCCDGSLAVPDADAIIPIVNKIQADFKKIIATKDWHPRNHASFASNHPGHNIGDVMVVNKISQVLWPDHCVQGTSGADFHPKLDVSRISKVIYKGRDESIDSYSAFFDNQHLRSTGLGDYLKAEGIEQVYVAGLATDYCVKYTCLDAAELGFDVYLIEKACRGVELKPGDIKNAIEEMKRAGVKVI